MMMDLELIKELQASTQCKADFALRDIFAAFAMQAMVTMIDSKEKGEKMPSAAYAIADQMMLERDKK
jgi:hypothetical protein